MNKIINTCKGSYTVAQGKKIQKVSSDLMGMLYEGVNIEMVKVPTTIDLWDRWWFVAVGVDGCRFGRVVVAEITVTKRGRVIDQIVSYHTKARLQEI